ncbi:MAG: DUF5716 family protein [Spirochaetaceae bacterium]|jgi:hypothetical protein|nr:DUF5716 family protein [Spirochaetaceae bacterium]
MNIFSLIPGNFFSILASGNREIYFDALMLLNARLKQDLNIQVSDYTATLAGYIEGRDFVVEKEDESPDVPDAVAGQSALNSHTKARLILARLIKTGWVDRETQDGSFIEIITPRDYAIRMMRLLDEMRDERIHEYSSLVYSTYSALKQAGQPRECYEAVLAAKRNTEALVYELKSLYHNIRSYIRRIQEQNDINELLENHFEKYKPMADRIYHPIKTMDSFYRYMMPVRELLENLREDDALLAGMRARAMTVRKYGEEEAGEEILSAIEYVEDTYSVIGNIINEIDRKHSAYTKNSIEKMTYMMSAGHSVKGKLLEIFKAYQAAEAGEAGEGADLTEGAETTALPSKPRRGEIYSKLRKHVNVYRQEFIDGRSLFHKNVLSRRLGGEALEIADRTPLSAEALLSLARQMEQSYPPERIREFVGSFFASGTEAAESETLPIKNDTDFIMLILAVARSRERGMDYTVELRKERVNVNGYIIPKMKFTKKDAPDAGWV